MALVLSTFEQLARQSDGPVRAIRRFPAKQAEFVEFADVIDERLRNALQRRGIERLYSHQAEAFAHAHAGRNAVIVTATASGKTLCYNLPVLNHLMRDKNARALYLFPTK
ncbi:MAG TPA: DEAD/DEAH box helicase, partial [Candidatus Acidoferrales bacterium]|nr:DEAD/DEAH box helicase [Candidatus Acidoferrales bacterium]